MLFTATRKRGASQQYPPHPHRNQGYFKAQYTSRCPAGIYIGNTRSPKTSVSALISYVQCVCWAVAGCLQLLALQRVATFGPATGADPDAAGVVSGRPVSDGKLLSFRVNIIRKTEWFWGRWDSWGAAIQTVFCPFWHCIVAAFTATYINVYLETRRLRQ